MAIEITSGFIFLQDITVTSEDSCYSFWSGDVIEVEKVYPVPAEVPGNLRSKIHPVYLALWREDTYGELRGQLYCMYPGSVPPPSPPVGFSALIARLRVGAGYIKKDGTGGQTAVSGETIATYPISMPGGEPALQGIILANQRTGVLTFSYIPTPLESILDRTLIKGVIGRFGSTTSLKDAGFFFDAPLCGELEPVWGQFANFDVYECFDVIASAAMWTCYREGSTGKPELTFTAIIRGFYWI